MTALLALDPSLDEVGYACFDLAGVTRPLAYADLDARYLASGTLREPLWEGQRLRPQVERMLGYIQGLGAVVPDLGQTLALVERPATTAVYGYNRTKGATARNMAGPMAKQHFAAGALATSLAVLGAEVLTVAPVGKGKKATLSLRDPAALAAMLPRLTRTSEHCRAACAIAIRYLTDHRRRWVAA